jgi:hypothetical protein
MSGEEAMSLLQSLFTDKKQSTQLHTAFAQGMQQARQHLWEAALPNFLIAVDLAHSYAKAQVMLCLCYSHQVDEESVKIHLRHLQKANAKLADKIGGLPGAARVLCLATSDELESPQFTRVLVETRDHHKLPSLFDLRLTPSNYLKLIMGMVQDGYITKVKIKDTKNPVNLPEYCCPSLTPKGEATLEIWESTFAIFADNVMAQVERD